MGKRKRSDDDSVPSKADSSDTVLGSDAITPNLCGTSRDEYDIWLIRKPTKIPLSDLSSIKFPHKAKNRIRLAMPSRSSAVALNCHFHHFDLPHVYIPTTDIRTQKDAMTLKATNLLKGVVLVNEKLDLLDDNAVMTSDDITVKQEPGTLLQNEVYEMDFKIKSIRKKPQLPVENLKQRLKPFGIIPKKKKKIYKLPNLINY